jgi:tRNA (guanine-N7-)-methyltransferase
VSSEPKIATDAEIVPANCCAPLDLEAIYGRKAPLEVDLGCGEGSFLAAIAAQNPERNFLGIERQVGRVRSACHKITVGGFSNSRVLRSEIARAVSDLLPAGSVSVFHLMFPDPWPKRRHAPRRLFTQKFLGAAHRALVANGFLRVSTDDTEYFNHIRRIALESPNFATRSLADSAVPLSKFEKIFIKAGKPIHRLSLRKVSPVT